MITSAAIIVLIAFIAWLSYRETQRSLQRAKSSENNLELERNALEQRVATRTTELVVAEQERLSELENAAQFGRLSKGLFHDLMNPLSSLSLYTERLTTLDNHSHSQEYREVISKMTEVSRRMGSFMDNLKNFTVRDHSSPTDETANLVDEILIVRDIIGYKARMAGVQIAIDTPPTLRIQANPMRVHQLILNLVTNAIEACEVVTDTYSGREKSVVIKLQKDTTHITLSVTDTGVGISPVDMTRLFKTRFTTKIPGTGTGLMTIHSVVESDLHGHIAVKSQEGRGTTFTVTIPVKE